MNDKTLLGIDYAYGRPGGKAIKDAGYSFVCRYLSNNPRKNLTTNEVIDLHSADLKIVAVWETTEQRMLEGYEAGKKDAKEAARQMKEIGAPDNAPIYFANDWDTTQSQQAAINQYLKGVISVIGLPRTGMYAGVLPLHLAFNAGLITYGWETVAWRYRASELGIEKIEPRAHIYQYDTSTRMFHGVSIDLNKSLQENYGGW